MDGKYRCLETYTDDDYGLDFLRGKVYEYRDEYMHSTENGTDVMIDEEELSQFWEKVE